MCVCVCACAYFCLHFVCVCAHVCMHSCVCACVVNVWTCMTPSYTTIILSIPHHNPFILIIFYAQNEDSLYLIYRMQFLVQAGIVKKPPRWLAIVEAFPPLPTPPVTSTRTREIVYKEEDQHRVSVTPNIGK